MLRADDHDLERYLRKGRQAVEVVSGFVEAPRSILDFDGGASDTFRAEGQARYGVAITTSWRIQALSWWATKRSPADWTSLAERAGEVSV